ncbi:hypothetical protein LWI29_027334 [Acer saccharum]|uniref:Pentatricopeptide repeat-containing protein n=1 Tax=Acer saccharum TaxID=4024 RepID=A0AA39VX47_ACESA|nr:hypothetical protein LWI29_027334 [Acer saccharum]
MKHTMAWTSTIIGLAMHGDSEEALQTFKRMQEDASVSPDQITYMGVLCACSHVGLVEEGQRHFTEMRNVYGIEPTIEHCGCMVDLLSMLSWPLRRSREIGRENANPAQCCCLGSSSKWL